MAYEHKEKIKMGVKKVTVLIVDDSAIVRQTLSEVLADHERIEVIATAQDPFYAAERIKEEIPDVIILDIEMPRMDGLTFLEKIMSQRPIPVIICSTLTEKGSTTAIRALELGAVDVITKPKVGTKTFFEESRNLISDAVLAAAASRLKKQVKDIPPLDVPPKYTADAIIEKGKSIKKFKTTEKVIALGASTGGTEAIRVVLQQLPPDVPGIVIVQHMPEHFTKSFADRLNQLCRISVKEAQNGDTVLPGTALIAPGNKHTLLKHSASKYFVEVKEGPLVNRHRPSVDVLFRSAARYAGKNACGIILTGMGDDGAKGMLEMKEEGAYNIAQNEETSVVFGMPKEAINLGGVDAILPLDGIAEHMRRHFAGKQ